MFIVYPYATLDMVPAGYVPWALLILALRPWTVPVLNKERNQEGWTVTRYSTIASIVGLAYIGNIWYFKLCVSSYPHDVCFISKAFLVKAYHLTKIPRPTTYSKTIEWIEGRGFRHSSKIAHEILQKSHQKEYFAIDVLLIFHPKTLPNWFTRAA